MAAIPTRHHLDRRALELLEDGAGDADDLLSTSEVAEWLGVSTQWLEIGRSAGYGPPFLRLSAKRIRYQRGAVRKWLSERAYQSTAEYNKSA